MGGSNIQAKFKQYQRQYPLYTRDAITDLMLKDGVITPDIAKKIKSGVSLFLIDNNITNLNSINNDSSITSVLGGNFSTPKIPLINQEQIIIPKLDKNHLKNKPFSSVKKVIDDRIRKLSQKYEIKEDINTQLFKDAKNISKLFKDEFGNLNSSSMQYFYEPYFTTYKKDDEIIDKMRSKYFQYELSKKVQLEEEAMLIKKYRMANCGECADMVEKLCWEQYKDKYNASTIVFDSIPSKQDNQHFAVLLSTKNKQEEYVIDMWINPEKGCIFKKSDWQKMCQEVYDVKKSKLDISNSSFENLKHEQYFWNNIDKIKKEFPNDKIKTIKDFSNIVSTKINTKQTISNNIKELYYMYCERYQEFGTERDSFREDKFNFVQKQYDKFYSQFLTQNYEEKLATLTKFLNNIKINSSMIDVLINQSETLISDIDKSCYGIGEGQNKKNLILPLVDYIKKLANLSGCEQAKVNEFETKVLKELNAIFYTDEKKIISSFKNILKELKSKYDLNSYLL